jgi:hypothetical protein
MHGMWGNPAHLDEAARVVREKAASRQNSEHLEFEVLVAQANQEASTYDGIDWGGERIADEVCMHTPVCNTWRTHADLSHQSPDHQTHSRH